MSYSYMDERIRKQIDEILDSLTVKDFLALMKVMSMVAEQVITYTNKMAHLSKITHGGGGVDNDLITTIAKVVIAEMSKRKKEEMAEEEMEDIKDLAEKLKTRKKAKETESANIKKEAKQSTQEKYLNIDI